MPYVNNKNVQIYYDVQGDSLPALVFVHGGFCNSSYWKNQVDYFSKKFKTVAIDLGGHGKSGSNREDWTMKSYADDVIAVVDELGLEKIILIGHSMGGASIVNVALRLVDRVAGIVGVDTFAGIALLRDNAQVDQIMDPIRKDYINGVKMFMEAIHHQTKDKRISEHFENDLYTVDAQVAVGMLQSYFSSDVAMSSGLREITVPKLLVNSQNTDTLIAEKHGITVIQLPDVGHFIMIEASDEFNRILEDFVKIC